MSQRIEKMLKEYPDMILERDCLAHQIANFRGISAEDVIESMYTSRMDGERVKCSGISDKTAQIALIYRERQDSMYRDWHGYLEGRMIELNDELCFFESAISSLPGRVGSVMCDLVVERMTWRSLAAKYHVSQRMIGKYRAKAITELEKRYETREQQTIDYILG